MDNLELIDAYLRDELNASQKSSFEQEMASDPSLKGEFEFQNNIVEGIKEARKIELKAMLDKVVVGSGVGQNLTAGKALATLIIAGLAAWGIFYFSNIPQEQQLIPVAQEEESLDDLIIEEKTSVVEEFEADETVSNNVNEVVETPKNDASVVELEQAPVKEATAPEINKPETIANFEGDAEAADSLLAPGNVSIQGEKEEMLSIDVKVDNTRKKFTFHYQFKNGRLFLYGDFSSDLYEILEFNTEEEKSLFLFYKGKFYDLNSNNERIVELKIVKSKALVTKLEEARTGN